MGTAQIERLQYHPTEVIGSRAFNIENERVYGPEQIRTDTISYLSEYRLRVQKYDYELVFSFVEGEGYKVRDIYSGETMSKKTKRTLGERKAKGLPIHREIAEDAGIASLDWQLLYAQEGDPVFWLSPPGPKEEGYGEYGFLYAGYVTKVTAREKNIAMTAIRIEHPTIGQSNDALSTLTGRQLEYTSAEDFLANPYVKQEGDFLDVDFTLHQFFSFTMNEKEEKKNKQIIAEMDPMIDEFVGVVRSGSREEKITAFYALENYALALKKRYKTSQEVIILGTQSEAWRTPESVRQVQDRSDSGQARMTVNDMSDYRNYRYLADILSPYGYRPPVVAGSCGPTGEETQSNDIFADNFKELMKAIFGDFKEMFGIEGDDWFKCPSCHYKATGPIGNSCPGCHITKEEYAKNTGKAACD